MKVSQKQLTELLSSLGLDVELVEDDNADFKPTDAEGKIKEFLAPDIKVEVAKDLESSLHGSWINTLSTQVSRTFAIPKKELEGKKVGELLEIIKTNSSNGKEGNEWKEKYEAFVSQSNADIDKLNADWQAKYDNDVGAANKKYIDRDINSAFIKITEKIPRKGGDLVEQADTLRYKVEKNGYEIRTTDNGEIEFWKDNRKHKNEDVITPIAKNIFSIAENTSHINPASVKAGTSSAQAGVENVKTMPANIPENITNWVNKE